MEETHRLSMIARAVQDFEGGAKRVFRDDSRGVLVKVGPNDMFDEELGIARGHLEISG